LISGPVSEKEGSAMSGKESFHDQAAHEEDPASKSPLWKRIGWLVTIWAGSVFVLFIFASLLRMFMTAAGMKSH